MPILFKVPQRVLRAQNGVVIPFYPNFEVKPYIYEPTKLNDLMAKYANSKTSSATKKSEDFKDFKAGGFATHRIYDLQTFEKVVDAVENGSISTQQSVTAISQISSRQKKHEAIADAYRDAKKNKKDFNPTSNVAMVEGQFFVQTQVEEEDANGNKTSRPVIFRVTPDQYLALKNKDAHAANAGKYYNLPELNPNMTTPILFDDLKNGKIMSWNDMENVIDGEQVHRMYPNYHQYFSEQPFVEDFVDAFIALNGNSVAFFDNYKAILSTDEKIGNEISTALGNAMVNAEGSIQSTDQSQSFNSNIQSVQNLSGIMSGLMQGDNNFSNKMVYETITRQDVTDFKDLNSTINMTMQNMANSRITSYYKSSVDIKNELETQEKLKAASKAFRDKSAKMNDDEKTYIQYGGVGNMMTFKDAKGFEVVMHGGEVYNFQTKTAKHGVIKLEDMSSVLDLGKSSDDELVNIFTTQGQRLKGKDIKGFYMDQTDASRSMFTYLPTIVKDDGTSIPANITVSYKKAELEALEYFKSKNPNFVVNMNNSEEFANKVLEIAKGKIKGLNRIELRPYYVLHTKVAFVKGNQDINRGLYETAPSGRTALNSYGFRGAGSSDDDALARLQNSKSKDNPLSWDFSWDIDDQITEGVIIVPAKNSEVHFREDAAYGADQSRYNFLHISKISSSIGLTNSDLGKTLQGLNEMIENDKYKQLMKTIYYIQNTNKQ